MGTSLFDTSDGILEELGRKLHRAHLAASVRPAPHIFYTQAKEDAKSLDFAARLNDNQQYSHPKRRSLK